jgi:hypothetical protein
MLSEIGSTTPASHNSCLFKKLADIDHEVCIISLQFVTSFDYLSMLG